MIELPLSLINLVTSTITGVTGTGGGMILVGLMPLFLPASAIVPVHGATQFASNASRAWFGRRDVDFAYIKPYVLGALVGVVVFGMAVRFVKLDLIPLFIAFYILLTQWSARFNLWLKSFENFYLIGFLQTGIGLFVGAAGPLHLPLLMKKYDNTHTVVAVASVMVGFVHLLKFLVHVAIGFVFLEYWQVIVMMIASAVAGSWIGVKLRHRLPMAWLKTALPYLLSVIAIKIIIGYAWAYAYGVGV